MKSNPSFSDEKCYCRIRFSGPVSLSSRRKNLLISPRVAVEAAHVGRGGPQAERPGLGAFHVGHKVMV